MDNESQIIPIVATGRHGSRDPSPCDVLVISSFTSNADLMKDHNSCWIVKNLRHIMGERRFAVDSVMVSNGDYENSKDLYKKLLEHRARISRLLKTYRPKLIVVFGHELAKVLKPSLAPMRESNVVGYVHTLDFKPNPVMICVPPLKSHQFVARNLDEIMLSFIKVPFLLDNPHSSTEGTIIDLDTDKAAAEYINFLLHDYKGFIAYDTETRNLNKRYHNRLASMQFATDDKTGYVLFWNHEYNRRNRTRDQEVLLPLLRKLFGGLSKTRGFVAHNAQFDISSTRAGLEIPFWGGDTFDSILLIHWLDQNRDRSDRLVQPLPGNSINELKQLVYEFFGYNGYEAEAKAARKDGSLIDLPYPRLVKYAGQDGFAEYRLLKFIMHWANVVGRREDILRFSKQIHSRALRTFQDMSYVGMLVDQEHVDALNKPDSLLSLELDRVKSLFRNDPTTIKVNEALASKKTNAKHFWEMPWYFDISKPMSKMMLFFDKRVGLGLEPIDPEKPSCDEDFQEKYKKIPQVKWLTEFSEVEKLRNTYVSKMSLALRRAHRLKTDLVDGRVHPNYNLNGTETGRLACLRAGTRVLMHDDVHGRVWMPIEDVAAGDRAYCCDDFGKIALRSVLWAGKTGTERCVHVSFTNWMSRLDTISLTADHEVLTDQGWKFAADLIHGDKIVSIPKMEIDIGDESFNIEIVDVNFDDHNDHDVYCFEVDDFHNFFAEGLCVKNCTKPNLQQIPRADNEFKKAVKSVFTTPKGTVILQADFAAAEVRMWGSLSRDEFLCKLLSASFAKRAAYRANPTDKKLRDEAEIMADVHKQTASLMFGVPIEQVDKKLRTVTKGITFGLIYGRGVRSIAEQLDRSEEETQALCDKFFKQFPDGVAWLNEQKTLVQLRRYVETPFKRRRYLPWINDEDQSRQASALRQSINTPVQSAAGDFATLSISLAHEEIHRRRLQKHFKLVNAVHDSTLVEIPASVDAIAEAAELIRWCFTVRSKEITENVFGFEMPAPMDVDMEISQRKAWKCTKCGNVYKAYKGKCDKVQLDADKKPLKDKNGNEITCAHTGREEVKLNGGWGTLIGLDETMAGYREAALGF